MEQFQNASLLELIAEGTKYAFFFIAAIALSGLVLSCFVNGKRVEKN